MGAHHGHMGKADATTKKDGEASSIVNAANDAEIDAAKVAAQKASSQEVKDYAQMMLKDHKMNKKEQSKVMATPGLNAKRNAEALTIRKDAEMQIKDLRGKSGAEFDKAYIDSQVKMHSELLSKLNDNLIPGAEKAEFRSFLEKTRDAVQQHLEQAQKLQASLK
jgi:putative membrane protein